jgi:hypothetical protein
MPSVDDMKEAYEKAKADQAEYSRNPGSPAAKKTARTAGAIMFVVGLITGGISYYLWQYQGLVSVLLAAATLTFLGLGLYLVAFGKMPKRR